jgi:hypothetical protein
MAKLPRDSNELAKCGETTVESALAELLEIFPGEHDPAIGKFISVKRQEFIDSNRAEVSRSSHIYIGYGQSPPSCSAATLDEAVAQVREGAAARNKKLSPKRRQEIASKAAKARWKNT